MNKFLQGKLKYLTLFAAGGLADLALAPFYAFPVLFISFPLFFIILNNAKNKRQAFFTGWMFGFGYFVFGLYWIANSLLVDAERFAWLIPFAVCGIPFGLAIYIGLVGLLYKIILSFMRRQESSLDPSRRWDDMIIRVILFATLWVVFELLRSWLFSGFPWNLIGYTALFSYDFSQLAALGGVYLLSYVVVIIALIPAYAKDKRGLIGVMILGMVIMIYSYHHEKFDNIPSGRSANIIIFQPNIEESLKWDPLEAKKQFILNIDAMRKLNASNADIILWPETGVPYYLNRQPLITELLASIAPDNGVLVTGGLRSEGETHADYRAWNTLYAISRKGIYASYDKIHLVPFGEFVPFRKYLPLEKITPGSLDFSRGEKRDVIKFGSGPSFLPLICYEVIFPEFAASTQKPDMLLNVTNDGWFGDSTGPYQHLAMSRMRAIEQGLPLLRAANSGISAVIDQNGNILDSLGLNQPGHIATKLVLNKTYTIYGKYGDVIILGLIILSMMVLLIFPRKQQ